MRYTSFIRQRATVQLIGDVTDTYTFVVGPLYKIQVGKKTVNIFSSVNLNKF